MPKINPSELIRHGGKYWERGDLRRVYLNRKAIIKLLKLNQKQLIKDEIHSLDNSKTYYCYQDKIIKSDISLVRLMFRSKDIECRDSKLIHY